MFPYVDFNTAVERARLMLRRANHVDARINYTSIKRSTDHKRTKTFNSKCKSVDGDVHDLWTKVARQAQYVYTPYMILCATRQIVFE